jgi:hypothetical protein
MGSPKPGLAHEAEAIVLACGAKPLRAKILARRALPLQSDGFSLAHWPGYQA